MRIIKTPPWNEARKAVKKFAWFPISLNNDIRWLEWVTIEYKYRVLSTIVDDLVYYKRWEKVRFIDKDEETRFKVKVDEIEHLFYFKYEAEKFFNSKRLKHNCKIFVKKIGYSNWEDVTEKVVNNKYYLGC